MKKILIFLLICLSLCLFAGCGGSQADPAQEQGPEIADPLDEADPAGAIEKIYADIDMKGLSDATADDLAEQFSIDTSLVGDFYVRYSSGRYGVADVFILQPINSDSTPQIREELEQVKLNRIREFEHYDIYNSYEIAQDAQIFEQGGYVIMLMLENMDDARAVIDHYIPR